jgi:plastocyanin
MKLVEKRLLALVAIFEAVALLMLASPPSQAAIAQTPRTAPAGVQNWQVQVDNTSPAGHFWGFNAYYPEHLQAHPGDSITFTTAAMPDVYHTVTLLAARMTPLQAYSGVAGGFSFPDEDAPGEPDLQTPFFINEPSPCDSNGQNCTPPCGRAGGSPCTFDGKSMLNSGVLVNPPPDIAGARGNLGFSVTLAPAIRPATYFFVCLVHGPGMSGSIDVLPADSPVQDAAALSADAQRSYNDDLGHFTDIARSIALPTIESNFDGSRIITVAAGGGSPDTRLAVEEFGVRELTVRANDTVVWSMLGGLGEVHTVSGFSATDAPPPILSPYEVVCEVSAPEADARAQADSYPPDIWNGCVSSEELHLTAYSLADPASGSVYTGGSATSGILLSPDYLASAAGQGSPFANSYSLTFTQPGTYRYACAVHRGMVGSIVVYPDVQPPIAATGS